MRKKFSPPIQRSRNENQEIHHISLVACIAAACTALRPLCLSCRARMNNNLKDTFFNSWADHFTTKRGYMINKSIEYWLKNIIAPYGQRVREELNDNSQCIIVCY